MNLNPILISQIFQLTSEITLKQAQLTHLLHEVIGSHSRGEMVPLHQHYRTPSFPPPQQPSTPDWYKNPQPPQGFPFTHQPENQSMHTSGYPGQRMPTNHPEFANSNPFNNWDTSIKPYVSTKTKTNKEPANVKDIDIAPLYQLIVDGSFPETFKMSPAGLNKLKTAGVMRVDTQDAQDKTTFIRIRGSDGQPTIQVVVLDNNLKLLESYTYSFTGRVKDGVEEDWVLTKRLEDYKVDHLQVQQNFFKGYEYLMKSRVTE